MAAAPVAIARCTVYCGSSFGSKPSYKAAAAVCGRLLAERGLTVVYGGGCVGLMGVLADAALAAGGKVVGVIPRFMKDLEREHRGLTRLDVVENMRQRKRLMLEEGDAFVGLPGGIGTLEELLEALEWTCAGRHRKPVGVVNMDGMYTPLLELLQTAVRDGFAPPDALDALVVADTVEALLVEFDRRAVLVPPPHDAHAATIASAECGAAPTSFDGARATLPATCALLADEGTWGPVPREYEEAAAAFARLLSAGGHEVILRGWCGGLAGAAASAAIAAGGRVSGVSAESHSDNARSGVAQRNVAMVSDRSAQKLSVFQRGDWYVALPGGVAVWEELLEILSSAQLGGHRKPIGVLNPGAFYDPLLQLLKNTVSCGFTRVEAVGYVVVAATPEALLAKLQGYAPTYVQKLTNPRAVL